MLQNRDYRVDLALSTSDALSKLDRNSYRLVLSDMGRTEVGLYNADAGIDLLKEIRNQDIRVPCVIFCSDRKASQFRDRVRELGGRAITSSATELRAILDELAPADLDR